jgi:transposase
VFLHVELGVDQGVASVISDLFGVSGRDMLEAVIAGERNPKVLAQLARGRMRAKIAALQEALDCAFFTDDHASVLRMMLDNIDHYQRQIDALTVKIEHLIEPYLHQVEQIDEVPGFGPVNAQDVIAEIGADMSVFATSSHLVSWAKFCPR